MAIHILLHHLPVKCKEIRYDSAIHYTAESLLQLPDHTGIQHIITYLLLSISLLKHLFNWQFTMLTNVVVLEDVKL